MKTGLIIFGVIFLVIGGLLYFVPMQTIQANTNTSGGGSTDTRTSSASVTVPAGWAYASATIGFILLIIGLVISDSTTINNSRRYYHEKAVEPKEDKIPVKR
jgi:TRAP-type C4-dicarboxylate transport system permease small subunit